MEHRLQCKELRAAVRVFGMRIHHTLRQLHQLAAVAD